ncbi:MAG: PorV/PorQ family protein [Bacteroidia bacterium]
MKHLTILILLFLPAMASGQYQYGFLRETFFGRQPSARAEAMGRGYSSIDGDLTSIFFNPAGIATIKGLEIDGSFSSPYYTLSSAQYDFVSIGYKVSDHVIVGLSRNHFTYGQEFTFADVNGNTYGPYTPENSNYTLTLSSQPIKNLFIGLNTNYLVWKPLGKPESAIYFDFGAIKKFYIFEKNGVMHSVNIGASITNFNNAKTSFEIMDDTYTADLPVITRYGTNYQFKLDKHLIIDTLETLNFLFQGEYKMLLNSPYHSGIHTGAEIELLEILSIRMGYYMEKEYNYGFPAVNKDEISEITYGFGLQLPIHKLTKLPLNINFDYTSLPQPSLSKRMPGFDNFKTYNLRLNWTFQDGK